MASPEQPSINPSPSNPTLDVGGGEQEQTFDEMLETQEEMFKLDPAGVKKFVEESSHY
jgi:hypothetical protein